VHKSLKGIKVIDLTQSVAGPFATQILGDFGAEVIKVEKMDGGDDTRRWGPPFWGDQSPHFLAYNRNKLSISLNLKIESDLLIFKEMIKEADVFVQNLRPGALDKLGLDESEIFKLNSKIIYCSINAFGHTGYYKNKPGYDPLLQAFSGLMSLNGEENGEPVRIPASILDQGTAMWCVIAIQNALRNRDLTGEGSRIETSLLNTALMWLPAQYIGYFADGTVPPKNGSGNISVNSNLEWESVNNSLGYILSVGTSSGGTDLVNALDLGNTTNYSFEQPLPEASTIYVTIIPYSINLLAENCREETFTTTGFLVTPEELPVPKFFTPNNDGFNDLWIISSTPEIEVSTVHIFNRYGQLLKQLFPDQGWDGSFNGKPMASDSYWYRIETSQGNSQIGFFMLKR